MTRSRAWLPALLFPLACACAASGTRASTHNTALAAEAVQKHDYVFVFLVSGASTPPDGPAMGEIMAGHFANMSRLADEGVLVLAGPLFEPRSEPDHRGIFVFDVPTVEDALALAASDPAIQAGVLEARAFPWRSATPLARLLSLHREAERVNGPDENPGASARGYVLASTSAIAESELDRLAGHPSVVLAGIFGGERAGTALVALAVETIPEAQAALSAAGSDPALWTCFPLFASKFLLEL